MGDLLGVIRVIDPVVGVGTEVRHVAAQVLGEVVDERLLLLEAGMVGGDGDAH